MTYQQTEAEVPAMHHITEYYEVQIKDMNKLAALDMRVANAFGLLAVFFLAAAVLVAVA